MCRWSLRWGVYIKVHRGAEMDITLKSVDPNLLVGCRSLFLVKCSSRRSLHKKRLCSPGTANCNLVLPCWVEGCIHANLWIPSYVLHNYILRETQLLYTTVSQSQDILFREQVDLRIHNPGNTTMHNIMIVFSVGFSRHCVLATFRIPHFKSHTML